MIHVHSVFKREEQAEAARLAYLNSYHPAAYGTRTNVWQSPTSGRWHFAATRFNSTD